MFYKRYIFKRTILSGCGVKLVLLIVYFCQMTYYLFVYELLVPLITVAPVKWDVGFPGCVPAFVISSYLIIDTH
mgnify:CR=1 FL=1